jgi:hypothetical protein
VLGDLKADYPLSARTGSRTQRRQCAHRGHRRATDSHSKANVNLRNATADIQIAPLSPHYF